MLKFKNQKGSVTLFALIAVLFFSLILFGIYNSNMNKLQTQDRDIVKIKQYYEENANEIYEKAIKWDQEKETISK